MAALLFGGGKKSSAPAASSDSTVAGPIIKQLDANDPLRRKSKGTASVGVDPRSRIATILSDKLGN